MISMIINITGHHVDVNALVKEKIAEVLNPFKHRFPSVEAVSVILKKDNRQYIAELNTYYAGQNISVKSTNDKLLPAIRESNSKLLKIVGSRRGIDISSRKRVAHSHKNNLPSEIIQAMDIA